MDNSRYSVLRDWIALAIILVTVPLSVFGGANISCVGQGLNQTCAPQAVFLSPLALVIAGFVAGLITRGWTGLFVVGVGQIAGQVIIVVLSYAAGRPVPIDLFSGMVATAFFGAPIAIGYGAARLGSRVLATRKSKGAGKPGGDPAA